MKGFSLSLVLFFTLDVMATSAIPLSLTYSRCNIKKKQSHSKIFSLAMLKSGLKFRGGGDDTDDEAVQIQPQSSRNTRYAADVIRDIVSNREDLCQESIVVRSLIASRASDYLAELSVDSTKPPQKVLHLLAPKIPAIKQSPDYLLRIRNARGDVDSGIAASLIATMARVSIHYDRKMGGSIGPEIIKDRRFEQLVECVLCGVDVRKRRLEAQKLADGEDANFDMEELLDEENVKIDEGLSARDACRAAWGIAVLGGHEMKTFGGQKGLDILMALSLRVRECLLARLQMLRQGEIRPTAPSGLSLAEGFDYDSEDLAGDAACALWTFACVKASTGLRTAPMFEACCSILCQNPTQLREREDAKKGTLDSSDFAMDNVVDKLAKSEGVDTEQLISVKNETSSDPSSSASSEDGEKDTLLHWLSSKETCEIMWAVAIHGRTDDTGSKQEMNLSETASALSEIAFDQIQGWLEEDLKRMKALPENDPSVSSADPSDRIEDVLEKDYVKRQDGVVVEVVDAAALLSQGPSQRTVEGVIENATAEAFSINRSNVPEARVQEIQVVDAAALLASEKGNKNIEVKSEVLLTSTTTSQDTLNSTPSRLLNKSSQSDTEFHFTNKNLCSIAYAVTDLQDSLRDVVVDAICEIFLEQGRRGVTYLDGGDLTNVAWAIARRTGSSGFSPNNEVRHQLICLVEWLTERALSLVDWRDTTSVFRNFQAPEIGRMMWSLAVTLSNLSEHTVEDRSVDKDFRDFAMVALKAADSHLSLFGTEDLARITWGFLELSILKDVLDDPVVSGALGSIVSTMESSILRWESCQCEKRSTKGLAHTDEFVRFHSFLGRSRLALRILEQRLDKNIDDDDDSSSPVEAEKSRLPLLRDLAMDPSTMSKLAYGLSRTHHRFPELEGCWTFTRVAIRLLCSKHGHLLKESSVADNVRLAYACATNELPGLGRDHATRLYCRHLVQRLNEKISCPEKQDRTTVSSRLGLSAQDMATLIWSLGALGAKHSNSSSNFSSATQKKSRLSCDIPFVSDEQLQYLSAASSAKLLNGAVSMDVHVSSPETIVALLRDLEMKLKKDPSHVNLCELAESLAKIKVYFGEVEVTTASPLDPITTELPGDRESSRTLTTNEIETPTEEKEINQMPSAVISESIRSLLEFIAACASEAVGTFPANHIRRLLQIYAGLPFQADDFVSTMDVEVRERLEAARSISSANFPNMAHRAATAARHSRDALIGERGSRLFGLRKSLRNLFPPSNADGEIEYSEDKEIPSSKLEEVASLLEEIATTAEMVSDQFARASDALSKNRDIHHILSAEVRGAIFELSRCQELIDSYRRINFPAHKRRSRHDGPRRTDIGRQVIMRIFQNDNPV
jgi:hypothetical protein